MKANALDRLHTNRRAFIGGSDARVIMGHDEDALLRLWREKRGEAEPEDLSGNLIVQLGVATEHLNRHWYQRNDGPPPRSLPSLPSARAARPWSNNAGLRLRPSGRRLPGLVAAESDPERSFASRVSSRSVDPLTCDLPGPRIEHQARAAL